MEKVPNKSRKTPDFQFYKIIVDNVDNVDY
jgi:hypothetical protein